MGPEPSGGARHPAAVVFDCDGTLVDTEGISDRAFARLLRRWDHEVTDEDMAAVRGRPWPRTWEWFRRYVDVDEATFRASYREIFVELFDRHGRFFDDAVATVTALAARDVPMGVCTSSSRRHLERVLDLGLREHFSVTVSVEDTTSHKPGPAPYLEAARRLGVDARACAAAEDSPVGVASARAAGMRTVAVVRPGHDAAALAEADVVVDTLTPGLFTR